LLATTWRYRLVRSIGLATLFLALTVVLQVQNGAYQGDYGAHPDEPSHYVNGLLVRDYVSSLSLSPPMEYAETYYLHYPKVAFGHWPPLFYVFEAAWMLLFSVSRASMMLMLAVLTALLATVVASLAWKPLSPTVGIVSGVVLVTLPLVQNLSRQVSPELLVALLILIAAVLYARYLETERWEYAAGFGLLASAACLTKGTGLVLALLPLFSIVFARKYHLLRTVSFWIPVPIVLVLSGSWYLLVPNALHGAALPDGVVMQRTNLLVFLYSLMRFAQLVGLVLSPFVLVGLGGTLYDSWVKKSRPAAIWVVMAALPTSFCAFRSVIGPALGYKNWIVVIGPCILLACYGAFRLVRGRLGDGSFRSGTLALVAVVLLALSAWNATAVEPLQRRPLAEVGELITADLRFRDSVVIVASDGAGEGALVAQVAMRERRPGHFVLRAGKVLASSSWFGGGYELRYSTPDELMQYLRSVPVGLLVVDHETRLSPQLSSLLVVDDETRLPAELSGLIARTLRDYAGDWELVGEFPASQPGAEALRVFRHIGYGRPDRLNIRVDMSDRLGKVLTTGGPGPSD